MKRRQIEDMIILTLIVVLTFLAVCIEKLATK